MQHINTLKEGILTIELEVGPYDNIHCFKNEDENNDGNQTPDYCVDLCIFLQKISMIESHCDNQQK
jgi:hypothetical protein